VTLFLLVRHLATCFLSVHCLIIVLAICCTLSNYYQLDTERAFRVTDRSESRAGVCHQTVVKGDGSMYMVTFYDTPNWKRISWHTLAPGDAEITSNLHQIPISLVVCQGD
jgi:hypothetical protein